MCIGDALTKDATSFANFNEIYTKSLKWNIYVSFDKKQLIGNAEWTVKHVVDGVKCVMFDTKMLKIHKVKVNNVETSYKLEESKLCEEFGNKLVIELSGNNKKDDEDEVVIEYETSPNATAIQWLGKEQTLGKKNPFLFTQCQAIHARSLLPCMDTPAIKFPYVANLTVPRPLVAKMSAISLNEFKDDGNNDDTFEWKFEQPIPIPSYLIAMVVGNIAKKKIGPRSNVWTEPEQLEISANEFADTEKFLQIAEKLCGKYHWGTYDLAVLPPSFPYGGMEGMLTFVTPTLLAGDRSLANVVAHEIAHSWMGNLVTSKTWDHFWLNEGFTVFLERKILLALSGQDEYNLHCCIGWEHLESSVKLFGKDHEYTKLVIAMEGVDPDDSFSSVPYEKGFNLLYKLQNIIGVEIMDKYLFEHCKEFAFKSIDSYEWAAFFKKFVKANLKDEKALATFNALDWEKIFKTPGMPEDPKFPKKLVDKAVSLATDLFDGKLKIEEEKSFSKMSTASRIIFVDGLIEKITKDGKVAVAMFDFMKKFDGKHKLTENRNAEVRFKWFVLYCRVIAALNAAGNKDFADETKVIEQVVAKWSTEVGRMKFCRPLYRELSKVNKELAVETFKKNRSFYHMIASKMIAKDLGVE